MLGLAVLIAACLAQAVFNTWSSGVAALLPSVVAAYAFSAPQQSLPDTTMVWVGAALAVLAATRVQLGATPRSAPARIAAAHAVALSAGCVILAVLQRLIDLPHGGWAILTFCLVFVPASHETLTRVGRRMLGTTIGAVTATAIAVEGPRLICLALAFVCAVMTVAYALTDGADLQYVVFLTPTIILLYGASRHGTEVLGLTLERVALTAVGGLLALALTRSFAHLSARSSDG